MLCWYGRTFRNIMTPFPHPSSHFSCRLAVGPPPPRRLDRLAPYCSRLYAHHQTLLPADVLGLGAHVQTFFLGPDSRNCRLDLSSASTSPPSFGDILSNSVALPEPRLAGLYASGSFSPLVLSPRPNNQESLFLRELGLVGF